MDDYQRRVEAATAFLRGQRIEPLLVLTLGTGLGEGAPPLAGCREFPCEEIPYFPVATAPGHGGRLLVGELAGGGQIAIFQGRFHFYEGYSTRELTLPLRVMAGLGARLAVFVSAAGGLDVSLAPGSLMLVTDHINFIPDNPLRGPNIDAWGPRFPDMSTVYDPELRAMAREAGRQTGCRNMTEGVYVAVPGPSLETPAETRFLRACGADAVGMSTVPEVIVARHAGMRVLALSVIVNVNNPDNMQPIDVDEVLACAAAATADLRRLLERLLPRIIAGYSPSNSVRAYSL